MTDNKKPKKIYKCEICDLDYSDKAEPRRSLGYHLKSKQHQLNVELKQDGEDTIKLTIGKKAKLKNQYFCPLCQYATEDKSNFNRHIEDSFHENNLNKYDKFMLSKDYDSDDLRYLILFIDKGYIKIGSFIPSKTFLEILKKSSKELDFNFSVIYEKSIDIEREDYDKIYFTVSGSEYPDYLKRFNQKVGKSVRPKLTEEEKQQKITLQDKKNKEQLQELEKTLKQSVNKLKELEKEKLKSIEYNKKILEFQTKNSRDAIRKTYLIKLDKIRQKYGFTQEKVKKEIEDYENNPNTGITDEKAEDLYIALKKYDEADKKYNSEINLIDEKQKVIDNEYKKIRTVSIIEDLIIKRKKKIEDYKKNIEKKKEKIN